VPQAPTLAEFVEGDFARLVLPRLKPSTRDSYKQLLEQPEHGVVALLGRKRLDAIGIADQRALEAVAISRRTMPRHACVVLHCVMREAYELGAISRPARLPKLPPKSNKLPLPPPEDVVVRVLGAASGWLRVALALAILAGLRMGEVRALRVRDVNLVEKVLYVKRTYSGDEIVNAPKGLDEEAVPLASLLEAILAETIAGKQPDDPVVAKPDGGSLSKGGVDSALRRIQRHLGIEPVWSLHKLRHYFATKLLRNKVNVEAVRRLLRHKHLQSTARYLHATASDLADAVAVLPGNCGETPVRPCP
jgi:integrase/recombinase XerD